jgi:serine/threonine protein kinase
MIGTQLGHYVIKAHLGAGGMGVVYLAFDSRLHRDVALKLLPDFGTDPKARERLLHEARSASALNHPHVCTIYDVRESDDRTYLVMEYVEGQPLSALIPAGGFPVETLAIYGSQIAGALAHAHGRGVVHRDLRSANIVVTPEGQAKVLDFGLATREILTDHGDTETVMRGGDSGAVSGGVSGTLAYIPPEVLRGARGDARADIWALGVVLYEMASARLPFRGHTPFELSGNILHEPPLPLPDHVPPTVRAIVLRCLAKDPSQRYQDAAEARGALDTVRSGAIAPSAAIARDAPRERRALVVLPFANLTADPESDFFADGLTDEIIADLSNVRQLRVISRTSSMQFKGTGRTVTELAKQLNVEYVLEGTVRQSGGRLRITAKLIEAATDSPVWADKYNGALHDVFAIQETISRSIVEALRVALTAEEEQRLAEHPFADVRAYEWYLRAKQEMLRFNKESLDRAVEYLEKSSAIVGENELLLAAKGEAYWQYVNAGISADPLYLDQADACARRVLEIDPRSPHGHRVAGLVRVHRGDIQGALRQLKKALDFDRNDPDSLMWGCLVAGMSGKIPLAEAWAARLVEVDPVTPFCQLMPGSIAWMSGDFEKARTLWAEHQSAVLENPIMRLIYGHVLVATGRDEVGDRVLKELARELPDNPFGQLGAVYRHAFRDDREQTLAGLTPSLVKALESDPQYCWFLAQCHALVHDVDAGIRWVEAAVARGFINHDLLATRDPFLANLRHDPR